MADNTFRDGASSASHFSVLKFFFQQRQAKVRTTTIVKVLSVTNAGGVTAVGFVDVQPLVQQVDGAGNVVSLPKLYHLPYLRIQGGTNAIILDPQVGDLGIAVFADRDISAVKSAKKESPPGSNRRSSLSDGMYLGGILNGVPEQYVQFNTDGITVLSPTKVYIKAPNIQADASTQFKVISPDIQLQGAVHITGAQTNDSTIVADGNVTGGGISLDTHVHSGVQSGPSDTGPPV